MTLTATFPNDRVSKVHFSEYLFNSADEEETTSPAPHQPDQPEAE